ncbi:hypothetical protein [Phenylobacterium aquaticum]|uniref:hypothetical protein n=1 Tax=Phenylobacterium aquaticum TaxID=1763816 RepID=UPI0026EDAD8F|nr:hypothetical protein [Phenylobacterium aquaticum]
MRNALRLGLALMTALMLAACAPTPAPADPQPVPVAQGPDAKACAAKGGTIRPVCMRGLPACVIPYRDAGKACADRSDCQGRCLYQGDRPADRDAPVTGQCQATSNPCGCFAEVEHGRYLRGLCVD